MTVFPAAHSFAMSTQNPEVLFVLNPVSGDIDKSELEHTIAGICAEHGRHARFFHTTGEQDVTQLERTLQEGNYQAVFAAGGDGTANLVAQVARQVAVPMGIIPLGSGNGLSKDLGITQDVVQALELVWSHRERAIDTLSVSGHFSVHLADLGFNALVVERFSHGDTRGPGAYVRIAMQEFLSYEPAVYRIETDQETFEGPAFMVTIANGNTFGSNVIINPEGKLDDGWFEICLIEPFPGTAALGILYQLYTENFDSSAYTRRLRCQRASISVPGQQQVLVQVDGEPLTVASPVTVEISSRSLQVLGPASEQVDY
ncbi:diacylglycerol/lipid kinase family protein [Hymenobacter jejuensis]|nr:diacylglycerol kinase family protein [Hymenobacter jejuensis]